MSWQCPEQRELGERVNRRLFEATIVVALLAGSTSLDAQDTSFVKALRINVVPFTIANGQLTGDGADSLSRIARETMMRAPDGQKEVDTLGGTRK